MRPDWDLADERRNLPTIEWKHVGMDDAEQLGGYGRTRYDDWYSSGL